MTLRKIFLREIPLNMIFMMTYSEESFLLDISKKVGTTFSHAWHTANKMEKHGLVTREKSGRKVLLTLTKKGREISESLRIIYNMLGDDDGTKAEM